MAAEVSPPRNRPCVFAVYCGNLDDSGEGGDAMFPLCESCFQRISAKRAKRKRGA